MAECGIPAEVRTRKPVRGGPLAQFTSEQPTQILQVEVARRAGHEPRVGGELRAADLGEEGLPVTVGVGEHAEVAVERPVGPPEFGDQVVDHRLEHGHLHRLHAPGPLALEQRGLMLCTNRSAPASSRATISCPSGRLRPATRLRLPWLSARNTLDSPGVGLGAATRMRSPAGEVSGSEQRP